MLDEWIRRTEEIKEKKETIKWNNKLKILLVLLVSVGLLALMWPGSSEDEGLVKQTGNINSAKDVGARTALSSELQNILSQVEGVGTVTVSLTLVSDGVKSYAQNTRNERRDTKETDQTGGERNIKEENLTNEVAVSSGKALLIEDRAPQVVGVLVVADGAGDALVKERLTDITTTLLHLYPHQVRVVAREVENQ